MSTLEFSKKYTWNSYKNLNPAIAYTAVVGAGRVSVLRFSLVTLLFCSGVEEIR